MRNRTGATWMRRSLATASVLGALAAAGVVSSGAAYADDPPTIAWTTTTYDTGNYSGMSGGGGTMLQPVPRGTSCASISNALSNSASNVQRYSAQIAGLYAQRRQFSPGGVNYVALTNEITSLQKAVAFENKRSALLTDGLSTCSMTA